MKMQEEDRNCCNILIGKGTEVFERMENNISNLNDRNMTFMGIILATLSIILTLILFLHQMGLEFSNLDLILLIFFCFFSAISLVITISCSSLTEYKDLNIFEQKRFDELVVMDEQTLLSDFLFHLKKSYEYNANKYNERTRWFTIALYLFIIANIIFVTFVLKNLIGG
jgi:heme/copper-type cytochrome/quinol oxidase subunit 4